MLANRMMMSTKKSTDAPDSFILYDLGDECAALTGGWIVGYKSGAAITTKESDNLQITHTISQTSAASYVTNNLINITNMEKLYIHLKGYAIGTPSTCGFYFQLASTKNTHRETNVISNLEIGYANNANIDVIHSLDVNALTGEYYVRWFLDTFGTGRNANYKVYKVWGE